MMHSKPTQLLCRHLINYYADTRGATAATRVLAAPGGHTGMPAGKGCPRIAGAGRGCCPWRAAGAGTGTEFWSRVRARDTGIRGHSTRCHLDGHLWWALTNEYRLLHIPLKMIWILCSRVHSYASDAGCNLWFTILNGAYAASVATESAA